MENQFILATCRECGNKGLQKKVSQFDQNGYDYIDEKPWAKIKYDWILLECPVCKSVSLFQRYGADYMVDENGKEVFIEKIAYPLERTFPNVPKDILKSYNAAVRTAKVDLSVSLIAIRAVLEKICKERGSNRKTLDAMLKQMVDKHIFPETLDKCGYVIRKMGNSGAHGDDYSMLTSRDIGELIDFIETIMYYIYELPVKVENLNRKYELKMEKRKEEYSLSHNCYSGAEQNNV